MALAIISNVPILLTHYIGSPIRNQNLTRKEVVEKIWDYKERD